MSEAHDKILRVLSTDGKALKIKEIAERTGLDPHAAARNLDVLEVLGRVRKLDVGTSKKYHLIESIPISGLIDLSSDLIVILDKSLQVLNVNRHVKQFVNLEETPVIGERLD